MCCVHQVTVTLGSSAAEHMYQFMPVTPVQCTVGTSSNWMDRLVVVGSAGAPGDVYMWNTALERGSITVNAWGNIWDIALQACGI